MRGILGIFIYCFIYHNMFYFLLLIIYFILYSNTLPWVPVFSSFLLESVSFIHWCVYMGKDFKNRHTGNLDMYVFHFDRSFWPLLTYLCSAWHSPNFFELPQLIIVRLNPSPFRLRRPRCLFMSIFTPTCYYLSFLFLTTKLFHPT